MNNTHSYQLKHNYTGQGSQSWDKQSIGHQQRQLFKVSLQQQILKPSFRIYDINCFPITTSPWISSINFIYLILFFIHILNFYFTIYQQLYDHQGLFSLTPLISPSIITLSYILNIILNILSLISFFYNDIDQQGFLYLIAWLGNKIFPIIRYLIEINLSIIAFIFIIDDISLGFFIITAIVNVIITLFAQNYVLRKDYLCCKNVGFMLGYKIVVVIGYLVNCIGYRMINKDNVKTFLIFIIIHLILSLLIMLCYFTFGFNIYRHSTPRILLIGSIIIYTSLSLSLLFDQSNRQLNPILHIQSSYIVYQIIFFILFTYFSTILLQSMRRGAISLTQTNFKKKIYYIFNIMENASESMDDDCQIRGILRYHIKNKCINSQCFVNKITQNGQEIYDSKKNKELFKDKINQGKSSLTKFYIKCLYEHKLQEEKWKNVDTILDYIEFFYMKLKNVFKVIHLINQIESKYLTPFQKLKLQRIKKTMRQENIKLNNQLYLSQLDIQNIIHAQHKFQQIKSQVCEFLKRNLVFWKYAQKDSIDLSQMSSIVQPNFKLVEKINNNWKQLAKYFQIQKRWKFYFVCYTLYVKNQKIKPQFLQYFGTNVHEQELFEQQSYHIDKTTEQEKLFNSKMLFQSNTCYIHISSHNQKSIIKKVSKYFTKIFKYEAAQILQLNIQILMPQSMRKIHQQKFLKWAGEGKSNNESTYQVKRIFPITKNNFIIPVYKFYKQVLYYDSISCSYQLQYIAMIKKNKQDQFVAIVNQNFQIQAFSESFTRKLKLKDEQYYYMKKMNILAFCPSLLKFTKFETNILKGDDDFKRVQTKKGNISHQVSSNNNSTQKQKKYSKILENKKQITQSNCRMLISLDLRNSQELYRKGRDRLKIKCDQAYYHGIREVYYNMKKTRKYRKFKAEIQVKRRSTQIDNNQFGNKMLNQLNNNNINNNNNNNINNNDNNNNINNNNNNNNINNNNNKSKHTYYQIYFRDMQQSLFHTKCIQQQQKLSEQVQIQRQFQQKQQQVILQDFHLYFESSSNSQSISLAFTNNIFIKQDNNKPVQMISHVGSITITVRIFFILFMGIVISVFFLQRQNSLTIQQRGIKLNMITEFQLKMFLVKNALYGKINKIENNDWVDKEILDKTDELISMKENYYLKKIILDENVNQYKLYGPDKYVLDSETPQYDQIDLVDLLIEKISTFRYMNISQLTLNNSQFITFQNYLLPSFNIMSNQTKIALNSGFSQLFQQTQIMTIILYIIQTILLFLGFFVVFTRLLKISTSFISLMQIFTQLSQGDIKKTYRYSEYIMKLFIHLNEKDQQMGQKQEGIKHVKSLQNNISLRGDQHLEEQVENANLNKKVKKVQIGQDLNKIKIKSTIFIILFMLCYGLSSFGFNIYMISAVSAIESFKNKGYDQLFKFVPNMEIAVHGMNKKYAKRGQYNNTNYQKIFINLQSMKIINTVFQTTTQFQQKYRIVFFDNFCSLYGNIFKSSQIYSQCSTIAQNSLQHGVQSYLYFLYSDVINYLIPTFLPINEKSLKDNHISIKIIDYYLLDLMKIWINQFKEKIMIYQSILMFFSIGLIIFHVMIYVLLVEVCIVGNLKEKYQVFKKIYLNYMPDFVVSKEKIIKAKLHVEGFLEN